MIFICDNCHHLFDPDTLHGSFAGRNKVIPQYCPFCKATTVNYKINVGNACIEGTFPAIRRTTFSESYEYNHVINEVGDVNHFGKQPKEEQVKIEEAIALITSVADKLSDDEYNMLLIFAFLYGYSTDACIWLKPILGLSRFRPGNRGRSVDPRFDSIRVYENVTNMFRSFVNRRNCMDSFSAGASHVASLMRHNSTVSARRSTTMTYKATIKNISIQTLCMSPSAVYLETVRKLVELCK